MFGLGRFLGRISAILAQAIMLACFALPSPASAQTVNTYFNNNDGNINRRTDCGDPLVRTFDVGTNYLVADVDIGVFATHSWRGDLRITLESPNGTRVQIVDGDTNNISGDNFNVLLDDSGTQVVNTDSATGDHDTSMPPPFDNTFIPNSALNAFAGESSAGTWTLEICDQYPRDDDGSFEYSALYLTSAPANYADLSLSKSVSSPNPASGASISYTLTVTNSSASPSNATGVTVTDLMPSGVTYTGHSGFGTYDSATGLWTVGTLTPGQSRTLTITGTVTASAGATILNGAEVAASSIADIDSTPGNGTNGEDDYDDATFTVSGIRTAGTPPNLMCPKSTLLFDWDTRAWTDGATSASYAITGLGTLSFSITNEGAWLNLFGGTNPVRTNQVTGGLTPAEYSLAETVNLDSATEVATTTITLPMAVDGVQFTLFDVDFGFNQFADWVRVTGTFGGSPVTPVLTNGTVNYTIGNEAFGDGSADNDEDDGNIVVTFQSAVDTIVIEYGNHSLAPSNPGQQAITIHDITLCEPHADIAVSKTSSVIDNPTQGTTDPAAIPGATISYCILVTNGGSAPATSVSATDPIPADMTFVAGSMQSGTTCAATSTAEDDDSAGGDETDAIGASFAGNQVLVTTASLGPSQSIALRFRATVN